MRPTADPFAEHGARYPPGPPRLRVTPMGVGQVGRIKHAVCLMHRRIGFVMPDGKQMGPGMGGSAVWYWGHRRARFHRIWGEFGWVVDCPGPSESMGANK